MNLVAITGSIGCGKTTIAKQINNMGFTVFDIDGWVRRLYFQKDFISNIAKIFPSVIENNKVNKRKLRNIVFSNNKELKKLEALIHPFLRKNLKKIMNRYAGIDDLFFIDVALLFEMGWDKYCDFIIVADVDYNIQKNRVMKRDNISADDFDKINNVQMSQENKKKLADIVVDTDKSANLLKMDLINIIRGIL